jgi:hypothetical protein
MFKPENKLEFFCSIALIIATGVVLAAILFAALSLVTILSGGPNG